MWLQYLCRSGHTVTIIYLQTFDIVMLSRVLIIGQILICYSTHNLVTQRLTDGTGGLVVGLGRVVTLGGTTDPLPLPISCTNDTPRASWAWPILYPDRSPTAPKPPSTTGHSPLPAVLNSLHHWPPRSLNKSSSSQRDDSCSLGLWHLTTSGIKKGSENCQECNKKNGT